MVTSTLRLRFDGATSIRRLQYYISNSPPTCSPLSPSITHSLFHSRLKTHLLHKSFPPLSASTHLDCLLGLYWTGLTLLNGFSC